MSQVKSNPIAVRRVATIAACTPIAMRNAGIPFGVAYWFHVRARCKGVKNETELAVFQMARQLVGTARLVH